MNPIQANIHQSIESRNNNNDLMDLKEVLGELNALCGSLGRGDFLAVDMMKAADPIDPVNAAGILGKKIEYLLTNLVTKCNLCLTDYGEEIYGIEYRIMDLMKIQACYSLPGMPALPLLSQESLAIIEQLVSQYDFEVTGGEFQKRILDLINERGVKLALPCLNGREYFFGANAHRWKVPSERYSGSGQISWESVANDIVKNKFLWELIKEELCLGEIQMIWDAVAQQNKEAAIYGLRCVPAINGAEYHGIAIPAEANDLSIFGRTSDEWMNYINLKDGVYDKDSIDKSVEALYGSSKSCPVKFIRDYLSKAKSDQHAITFYKNSLFNLVSESIKLFTPFEEIKNFMKRGVDLIPDSVAPIVAATMLVHDNNRNFADSVLSFLMQKVGVDPLDVLVKTYQSLSANEVTAAGWSKEGIMLLMPDEVRDAYELINNSSSLDIGLLAGIFEMHDNSLSSQGNAMAIEIEDTLDFGSLISP